MFPQVDTRQFSLKFLISLTSFCPLLLKKKKERTEIAGILAYVRVGDKGAT